MGGYHTINDRHFIRLSVTGLWWFPIAACRGTFIINSSSARCTRNVKVTGKNVADTAIQ